MTLTFCGYVMLSVSCSLDLQHTICYGWSVVVVRGKL